MSSTNLPATTAELSPAQHGWLKLAAIKANCFEALARDELAVQGLLNNHAATALADLQEAIKKAKQLAADSKSQRMHFTNMLNEKLIAPAMEYEKRNDALIAAAAASELDKRKAAAAKAEADSAVIRERAMLKAHIQNEFARIATAYRADLLRTKAQAYAHALQQELPVENLPEYKQQVKDLLCSVQLQKPVKYERRLVSDQEAQKVLAEVERYNAKQDLDAAIESVDSHFELYEQDLHNAPAAIEATTAMAEEQIASQGEDWQMQAAATTMVANATFEMTGGPTVKRVRKIVLEDTEQFAATVLATFMQHWPEASKKLGTKSWTKLVDPFVKALDKMDKEFPNLKYEEKCK